MRLTTTPCRPLAALLLAAALAPSAAGQGVLRTVGRDVAATAGDIWAVWVSPFQAGARDWTTAGLVVGGAAVTALADEAVIHWIRTHPDALPMALLEPVREQGSPPLVDLGSNKRLLPLSGALYLVGLVFDARALRDAGLGCAASQQANAIVRDLIYRAVSRPRPSVAPDDPYHVSVPGGPWEVHSFPAGHAANVTACAAFVTTRFELGAAEPVLLAFAVALSVGRIADLRHWPSDTVLGVAFGYAVGRTIGLRSRRRAGRAAVPADGTAAAPPTGLLLAPAAGGVLVGWRTTF